MKKTYTGTIFNPNLLKKLQKGSEFNVRLKETGQDCLDS